MNTETTQKNPALAPEEITQKDVTKAYLRWHFANEIPHSFDRYLAPSLLYGMMPVLKKLYKDPDKRREAYKRQLLFFNTQLTWGGGVITGLMQLTQVQCNISLLRLLYLGLKKVVH